MKDLAFWFIVFFSFCFLLSLSDPKAAEKMFNFLFWVLSLSWVFLNVPKTRSRK